MRLIPVLPPEPGTRSGWRAWCPYCDRKFGGEPRSLAVRYVRRHMQQVHGLDSTGAKSINTADVQE